MANYNFQVNIDSIDKFAKNTKNTALRLEEILDYLIRITNDMPDFFDTPSANMLQEYLLEYLNNSKHQCDKLDELSNKIDFFNKNYMSIYNDTKISVGEKV